MAGYAFPSPIQCPITSSVEPQEGWVDPLGDYRKALFQGGAQWTLPDGPVRPCPQSTQVLPAADTYVLSLILNDYVRFFRPGRYVLQAEDSGVTSEQHRARSDARAPCVNIESIWN